MVERANLVREILRRDLATIRDMAKAAAVSERTVRRWRAGDTEPTLTQFTVMLSNLPQAASWFVADWLTAQVSRGGPSLSDDDDIPAMRKTGLRLMAEASAAISEVFVDMTRSHETEKFPLAAEIDKNRALLSKVVRCCEVVRGMGLRLKALAQEWNSECG